MLPPEASQLSPLAEKVGLTLMSLQGGRMHLQSANLQHRLAAKTSLSLVQIQVALKELYALGLVTGVTCSGLPSGAVRWLGVAPPAPPQQVAWEQLLAEFGDELTLQQRAALACQWSVLDDVEPGEQRRLLQGLLAWLSATSAGDPWLRSARYVLGSSKAARNLSCLLQALGGTAMDNGGELYVITAGPEDSKAVVLIENPRVFAAFARSRHAESCLGVAAYGYGLTMENFAQRLARNQVVCCPASGARPDLAKLIACRPTYYWGDLDLEGLRIYETLKLRIPALSLSKCYAEMDALLDNPMTSHPYHRVFDKGGRQRPPKADEPAVAYLARRCRERAVDQEAIAWHIDTFEIAAAFSLPVLAGANPT